MTMKGPSTDRTWEPNWPLLLLPPVVLFVKDVIAITAVLATEPGITARTKMYFVLSQLPGAFFFDDLNGVMLFNYILAVIFGGILWLIAVRRSRRRATHNGAMTKDLE